MVIAIIMIGIAGLGLLFYISWLERRINELEAEQENFNERVNKLIDEVKRRTKAR